MRFGIKYCGGCNPEYDRVALVEQLKKRVAEAILFIPPENGKVDSNFAVCGCKTACADVTGFEETDIQTITGIEEAKDVIRDINKKIPLKNVQFC